MTLENLPVSAIVVMDRARKSIGNVLGLAESIKRLGLLHPIVVNTRRELVAGGRRLAAVKKLGWTEVPCYVVGTLDEAAAALQAERDENTCREPLAPTELVALGRRLEAIEKPKAKERQKAGGGKPGSGKLPEPEPPTRDKVGEAVGVSGRTYEKAKQVVEAAEADPETFGDLPVQMDETSVDAAHKELKARTTEESGEMDPCEKNVSRINQACHLLDSAKAILVEAATDPSGRHLHIESIVAQIEAARKAAWQSRPTEACNCVTDKPKPECKACYGLGKCPAARVLKGVR